MAYSGWQVWTAYGDYRAEAEMHGAVMEYKPEPADGEPVNQSVIDLQAEYPDAVGWLTVPGTKIDYPFVQSKDNDYYLRRDLDGNHAMAGTLFMDYRCEKDFTSRNTIIYGHHMKNGSMFGTLKYFAGKEFFDANRHGAIYLPNETLALEFFAYMVVKSTDTKIYSIEPGKNYLDYVRQNARQVRDIGLADGDKIVSLSTCSYEFDNARMVLLARIA
jgi:sortase B